MNLVVEVLRAAVLKQTNGDDGWVEMASVRGPEPGKGFPVITVFLSWVVIVELVTKISQLQTSSS